MNNKKLIWKEVKEIYEKKYSCEVETHDWSTPELVLKYIEKYKLYSSSAEMIFSLKRDDENKK